MSALVAKLPAACEPMISIGQVARRDTLALMSSTSQNQLKDYLSARYMILSLKGMFGE